MQTNHLGWYIRSSWMIEVAGIPYHKENCIQLISKLAELVEITNCNKNQTDLAHRTSTKTTAPICLQLHPSCSTKRVIESIFIMKGKR